MKSGTVYLAAIESVQIQSHSIIQAPATLICSSDTVNIEPFSAVRADGLGCSANKGPEVGAGQAGKQTSPYVGGGGGGGKGQGGKGGISTTGDLSTSTGGGGMTNLPSPGHAISSGAGGGCNDGIPGCFDTYITTASINVDDRPYNLTPQYSAGGGIVVIYANLSLSLNGLITASGANGYTFTDPSNENSYGAGGGSGGTVILISKVVDGNGTVKSDGGDGGNPPAGAPSLLYGGGGGGGGLIEMYDLSERYSSLRTNYYNFTGLFTVDSGRRSIGSADTDSSDTTFSSTDGKIGAILWPRCEAGYGNEFYGTSTSGQYNVDSICSICTDGTYSDGKSLSGQQFPPPQNSDDTRCRECAAITESSGYGRNRASYANTLQSNYHCLCQCDLENPIITYQGRSHAVRCIAGETDVCLTSFEYALINVGGKNGLISILVVIFAFFVTVIYRKQLYSLFFKKRRTEVFARKFGRVEITPKTPKKEGPKDIELSGMKGSSNPLHGSTEAEKSPYQYYDDSDDDYDSDGEERSPSGSSRRRSSVRNPMQYLGDGARDSSIEMTDMRASRTSPLSPPKGDRIAALSTNADKNKHEVVDFSLKKEYNQAFGIVEDDTALPRFGSGKGGHSPNRYDRSRDARLYGAGDINHDNENDTIKKQSQMLHLTIKMGDSDMPNHAYRLYLHGTNHPFASRGGPWIASVSRPTVLRPMLDAKEYRNFMQDINTWVAWKWYEIVLVLLMMLLFPPFVPIVVMRIRRQKGLQLLSLCAGYDHSCFRLASQRRKRSSLRVGISPCWTLAYIDFLYDEEEFGFMGPYSPLCTVGQVKLPAVFRVAGMGTFSTPWTLDTNDLLLQTVSQTDVRVPFLLPAINYCLLCHLITLMSILTQLAFSASV
jgi:hypothetical protein